MSCLEAVLPFVDMVLNYVCESRIWWTEIHTKTAEKKYLKHKLRKDNGCNFEISGVSENSVFVSK